MSDAKYQVPQVIMGSEFGEDVRTGKFPFELQGGRRSPESIWPLLSTSLTPALSTPKTPPLPPFSLFGPESQ